MLFFAVNFTRIDLITNTVYIEPNNDINNYSFLVKNQDDKPIS